MNATAAIPLNDLRRHLAPLRDDIAAALDRVAASGWYVLGSEGKSFERAFADYCGAADCIGLANGTDALEIGLRAIGAGPGSQVAMVANAGFYGATALLAIGARPLFIDVDPATHLMDLRQLAARLEGGGVDAVLVTHLYGRLHDMEALLALTEPRGIPVLEDCAQAHGAERGGRRAGSFGRAATFSFYPTKNLGALGDGGALVTSDPAVAEQARLLRQYGWDRKYHVTALGARNSRLDEIQAAVLAVKLPHLDAWNARRRAIAARYGAGLRRDRLRLPEDAGTAGVAHLYVVVCDDRESLRAHLTERGIGTDIHYPLPDHRQPALAGLDLPALPVTEDLAGRVLSLPCFPELTDAEVDHVIACVNAW